MADSAAPHAHPLNRHVTVLFGAETGKYPDGNSVLVKGRNGSVLIDPSLSVRGAHGPLTVDHVLLTHAHEDHLGGLSAVRFGDVGVHRADLPALQSIDGLMRLYGVPEGDWPAMTQLVVERFYYEGWPDGHSVYLIESDNGRVLVTGDIDLSSFGPYYGDAASGLDDFEHTLQHVRGIEADHYVTFHHKGVVDGHDAFVQAVDAYAAVIARRHAQLLRLLEQRRTFDDLVTEGIVYRPGTRPAVFGESVERYTIRRHLERALGDSSATTDGHHYWRTEVQA
jgi:glyoxylase-like metal-dependent hydrolase (beta-lactamase superfamily II)